MLGRAFLGHRRRRKVRTTWRGNNLALVLTYEGTSEVHQLVIGQALTGHAAHW